MASLHPEYKWIGISSEKIKRINLIEMSGLNDKQIECKKKKKDCYKTFFRYPDEMKIHFDKT